VSRDPRGWTLKGRSEPQPVERDQGNQSKRIALERDATAQQTVRLNKMRRGQVPLWSTGKEKSGTGKERLIHLAEAGHIRGRNGAREAKDQRTTRPTGAEKAKGGYDQRASGPRSFFYEVGWGWAKTINSRQGNLGHGEVH